jgi:cell cycle arrest protein BUB3
MKQSYSHSMSVLDCCFYDQNRVYSGGLDKTLKLYDLNAEKEFDIGTHNEAIRCVHYSTSLNLIITGSWDSYVKIWDPRMSVPVSSFDQHDKV